MTARRLLATAMLTNLVLLVAQDARAFYSPPMGRFLSRDPIGYAGSEWNLYEYVESIPTGLTDPTGRVTVQGTPIVGIIGPRPEPRPIDQGGGYYDQGEDKFFDYILGHINDPGHFGQIYWDSNSFITALQRLTRPGECIGTLVIGGHGNTGFFLTSSTYSKNKSACYTEADPANRKSSPKDLFSNADFCPNCKIHLNTCGASTLPDDGFDPAEAEEEHRRFLEAIAEATGCEVTGEKGTCSYFGAPPPGSKPIIIPPPSQGKPPQSGLPWYVPPLIGPLPPLFPF